MYTFVSMRSVELPHIYDGILRLIDFTYGCVQRCGYTLTAPGDPKSLWFSKT